MRDTYKTETLTQHGKTYRVEWVYDHDAGAPWDNSDCHGIVSDWETRDKRPGELILNQNGRSKRFYDFAASVKKHALKVGTLPPTTGKPRANKPTLQQWQILNTCADGAMTTGTIAASP